MALSATFTANFSSFFDAVEKADTKLKDFGAGADKVGGRLSALGNSFSGVKIIQDATLMAKAVDDIGGTAMLTEKELGRLGSTAQEAVAKMKALGMEVPQNLQKIADETKNANKQSVDWIGTLKTMAGALGIAFGVDAIKQFIGSVFDAAGAVKDLSDQWGVSTQFVQQWSAAAKLSGVEAEQLGKSIQFITEKLSESSPEYVALLKNIGLSAEALRKMSTEDAYKTIIDKIAGITDSTLQLDVAMGILGPNAKKVIGGIRDGMSEAAKSQAFMSDETIKRLEAAGDSWEKFKNRVIIYSGEMLGQMMSDQEIIFRSWGDFFTHMGLVTKDMFTGANSAGAWVEQQRKAADASKGTTDALDKLRSGYAAHGQAVKTTAQVDADLKAKTDALTASEKVRTKALEDGTKEQDAWNKRLQAEYNAVIDLKDAFSGDGLIKTALQYVEALKTAIPISEMTEKQQANINQVMEAALEVYAAAGKDAPQAMYDIWAATVKVDDAVVQMAGDLESLAPILTGLPKFDMGESVKFADPTKANGLAGSISEVGRSLGLLGQLSHGAFGEIATGAANAAGGMDLGTKASKDFYEGLDALNKQGGLTIENFQKTATGAIGMGVAFIQATQGVGMLQAGIQGAMVGLAVGGPFAAYTAAAGFVIGAMVAHFRESADLTGKEVRQLRQDAVDAAGGFELLASRMETAGISQQHLNAAYEDPAKLQAALDEINAAFKYQDDALKLLTETAEHYGFTLEQLGPALQRATLEKQAEQLYQDFKVLTSAGIDQVLVTEKMSEAVNDYVHTALKMGQEIPSAMKPMLESFVKSGQLVDENGNAITDLEKAGISFSLTMSDGFKVLINEVQKLTDVISRSLGTAIKEIPAPQVQGHVTWAVDKVPTSPASGEAKPMESYQTGTDGFRNFGKGTPVMLHGWEAVVPREDAGAFATVAATGGSPGGGAMPAIIINAQGAFFDTPESLQRLANKVGDALTAKHSIMGKLRAAV